jgi:hypothetical protein
VNILCGVATVAWVLAANSLLLSQNAPLRTKLANRPSVKQPSVNQDSRTIGEFSKSVDDYGKLRKRAQAGLPARKSGESAADIKQYQAALAQKIRGERSQAKPGEIFTPPVSQLFRKLIATPLQSSEGDKIRASLRHAEPVRGLNLEINQQYPAEAPLQSTPPTLLVDLPRLPPELEFRVVGRDLVLLDTTANLIVDLLPDALPSSAGGR